MSLTGLQESQVIVSRCNKVKQTIGLEMNAMLNTKVRSYPIQLFLPIVVTLGLISSCQYQTITFDLKLKKEVFVEGEPIYLKLRIKNTGAGYIKFDEFEDLYLIDENNNLISGGLRPSSIPKKLSSGEEVNKLIDLTDRFGSGSKGGNWYLRKGKYWVSFKLPNGEVSSERTEFFVRGRNEIEEKVFQKFLNARANPEGFDITQKQKILESRGKSYEKLTDTPTNTVFDPLFIRTHLRHLSLTNKISSKKFFELSDRYIRNHIEGGRIRIILLGLFYHFQSTNNKQAASLYFNNLRQKDLPADILQFIENRVIPRIEKI